MTQNPSGDEVANHSQIGPWISP